MASSNTIPRPPPPPSSAAVPKNKLNPCIVQKAINALLKWKNLQNPKSQSEDFIYLLLTLKKIPPKDRRTSFEIPLEHPLRESLSSEFCLVIDDRPKPNPKHKVTSEAAMKKIKSENLPITKILKLSKLKSDYKSFEAKKELFDSYDMFFADKRVVPFLPKLLGKQFYKKKKKVPVPVDLIHGNWKEQIERASNSVLLCLNGGTCSVVKVGKDSMEKRDIFENVVKVIDEVVEVVPRKWTGVRSFHLKFSESLALPIYQALPDIKLRIEGVEKNVEKEGFKGGVENKVDDKMGSLKKGVELLNDNIEDGNESEEMEDDELGSAEIVRNNRKEGDLVISGNKRVKENGNSGWRLSGNQKNDDEQSVGKKVEDGAGKIKHKKGSKRQS